MTFNVKKSEQKDCCVNFVCRTGQATSGQLPMLSLLSAELSNSLGQETPHRYFTDLFIVLSQFVMFSRKHVVCLLQKLPKFFT